MCNPALTKGLSLSSMEPIKILRDNIISDLKTINNMNSIEAKNQKINEIARKPEYVFDNIIQKLTS